MIDQNAESVPAVAAETLRRLSYSVLNKLVAMRYPVKEYIQDEAPDES